jgi:hypothetical protein
MEPVQSIEIVMNYEEENISFNVEDEEVVSIFYEKEARGIQLFITNKEKTVTEVIVPFNSISSLSIIR